MKRLSGRTAVQYLRSVRGGATVEPFPSSRRLVTAAVRAGRRIVPMHGLVEIDVMWPAGPGTVAVTAVGMFGGGGGFALAPPTSASLVVVISGISKRSCVVEDRIEIRDVVDLTVTLEHSVVDGAPATRFTAELRRLVHTAAVLQEPPTQSDDVIETGHSHVVPRLAETINPLHGRTL